MDRRLAGQAAERLAADFDKHDLAAARRELEESRARREKADLEAALEARRELNKSRQLLEYGPKAPKVRTKGQIHRRRKAKAARKARARSRR